MIVHTPFPHTYISFLALLTIRNDTDLSKLWSPNTISWQKESGMVEQQQAGPKGWSMKCIRYYFPIRLPENIFLVIRQREKQTQRLHVESCLLHWHKVRIFSVSSLFHEAKSGSQWSRWIKGTLGYKGLCGPFKVLWVFSERDYRLFWADNYHDLTSVLKGSFCPLCCIKLLGQETSWEPTAII